MYAIITTEHESTSLELRTFPDLAAAFADLEESAGWLHPSQGRRLLRETEDGRFEQIGELRSYYGASAREGREASAARTGRVFRSYPGHGHHLGERGFTLDADDDLAIRVAVALH